MWRGLVWLLRTAGRRALREVATDRLDHTKPQKESETLLRTDVQSHQSGLLDNSQGLEEENRTGRRGRKQQGSPTAEARGPELSKGIWEGEKKPFLPAGMCGLCFSPSLCPCDLQTPWFFSGFLWSSSCPLVQSWMLLFLTLPQCHSRLIPRVI